MKAILLSLALIGTVQAAQLPLSISQSQAFAELKYDCGGINLYETATGFDSAGQPQATVYLKTTCSGGGRGSHPVIHSMYLTATWDLSGTLLSLTNESAATNVFVFGSYTESTVTGTFAAVPSDPYVYSTAYLTTP